MMATATVTKIFPEDMSVRSFKVANGNQISKGLFLELTDPVTAVVHTGGLTGPLAKATAGISFMEKEASDGSTQISCWTRGRFKGVASGAILLGQAILATKDNKLAQVPNTTTPGSGAIIIGHSLEAAADGDTFEFEMRL